MAKNRIRRPIVINGVKRWISGSTEQEYAENLLMAMAGNDNSGSKGKHVFREYADTWFEVFSRPNISDVTAITYERQLRLHINPQIGDMFLEDVQPADIQRIFNAIGGAKATKEKAKMVLSMIFKQALEDELIRKNPLSSTTIRITGRTSKPTDVYSIDQMRTLVSKLPEIRSERVLRFLALIGLHPLRQEEALGLKWEDIDFEKGIIHVRRAVTHPDRNQPIVKETKTGGSVREIALVGEAARYLPGGNPKDFVLGGRTPLSHGQVRTIHRQLNNMPDIAEHVNSIKFRTTVLTDIYDRTKDVKATQAAAGHADPALTMRYYAKGRGGSDLSASSIASAYGLRD